MATYRDAGVDRGLRRRAKKFLAFEKSHSYSRHGKIVSAAFNNLYPAASGVYQVKTADTAGTKVLLAQLANKHDTIGIDAMAMVANDCIRCGAQPVAITDIISIRKSSPEIIREIQKGLAKGAELAECPVVGGEVADVPELLSCEYDIGCDCVGEVSAGKIIYGNKIKAGDAVIGVRSSGLHSNGISLARKVLFREWGGKYDAHSRLDGIDKELIFEALEPTRIYVKEFMQLQKSIKILAAVHITGDAYLKFSRLVSLSNIGFELDNFQPQEIFNAIKAAGNVESSEMFSTFNMGWGFAAVVRSEDAEDALTALKGSEIIGRATRQKNIIIRHKNEKIVLK